MMKDSIFRRNIHLKCYLLFSAAAAVNQWVLSSSCLCKTHNYPVRVHVCYLGQFVAAFMLVKRWHGRLGRWTVQPLGSAFHRIFWCPSLCDEQGQEHQELLGVILEKLLRCI